MKMEIDEKITRPARTQKRAENNKDNNEIGGGIREQDKICEFYPLIDFRCQGIHDW